jgi:hypothetical protein
MNSYRKRAWLFHSFEDPLENTVGHWTSEPNGVMSFHPWDINMEAHDERLAAGPAVMPSQHHYDMEAFREAGRAARIAYEERALAMLLAED